MGGTQMSRWWAMLPLAAVAGVPICTGPSWPVIATTGAGVLLCALGIGLGGLGPITAGAVFAIIGYTAALCLGGGGVNVLASMVFGLALLFLLNVSEFARRFRGADVAADVIRGQTAYWLGRAVAIVAVVAMLTACGFLLSLLVPSSARAVVAGLGVMIAFAAALYAGIVPTESGG